MYRPQRRTVVPTNLVYEQAQAHATAAARAPPVMESSVEAADYHDPTASATVVHNHYYERSPIRLGAHETNQDQVRMSSRSSMYISNDTWFWCCIASWVILCIVILGLLIAICCVSASSRRAYYYDPFFQQQRRWQ